MNDKILRCQDCYREFVFTTGQQKHFSEHGWKDPVRCPNCRAEKKRREAEIDYAALMRGYSMRLHSKPGRGFFRKMRSR